VVRAETRRLESGVSFTGELSPVEVVDVVAHFDGDLEAVLVREGQAVRRGQPLARYKPRDVKDAWQAADAELQSARANLDVAQNAERRARRLLEAGAAAPSELEATEAGRRAAEAQVRSAEARVNKASEDSVRLDVPSTTTGWVSKVHVHAGSRTAIADPIVTLVKTDTLELSATVPAEALGRVQRGTPIRFHVDAYPGEVFSGSIDRLSPTTEPGTRQVRIYMRLPNPGRRLVGGLFASGRVVDASKERATAAPLAALRQEGAEQVVYRLQGGVAQRLPVRTGLLDEEAGVVEVLGSVGPGDSLLTGVLPGLRQGVRVRVLGNGAGATGRPVKAGGAARDSQTTTAR